MRLAAVALLPRFGTLFHVITSSITARTTVATMKLVAGSNQSRTWF
jgi:hypothetical protein